MPMVKIRKNDYISQTIQDIFTILFLFQSDNLYLVI